MTVNQPLFGRMQERPLLISSLLAYAAKCHPKVAIVSRKPDGTIHHYTYREAEQRARRLASALSKRGIGRGDRVATLAVSSHRHLECFYGVSGIGAVLHTVNPRLFEGQIRYIINHAQDRLLLVDRELLPLVHRLADVLESIEAIIVLDELEPPQFCGDIEMSSYEALLAEGDDKMDWPSFDERLASSLCYTSGTTGNPKGVLYSHRSTVLHAMGAAQNSAFGVSAHDVIMPVSPMYHANAWSFPYVAPMCGAKLVLPGAQLDGSSLTELINRESVTFTCAVPTVLTMLLEYLERTGAEVPSLRRIMSGGSAVPERLKHLFRERHGVEVLEVWGMTELSPLGCMATTTPAVMALAEPERSQVLGKAGRVPYGVEMLLKDPSGLPVAHDGRTPGSLWVRGPWVAGGYFAEEGTVLLDDAGYFPTGDVATIDPYGYLQIVDRAKDVIKSGGEWISSIELEQLVIKHTQVASAAVVGIPHPKWEERPLLIIVPRPGELVSAEVILSALRPHVSKWWLPDAIMIENELPMTATGKVNKRALREKFRGILCGDPVGGAREPAPEGTLS